MLDEMSIQQLYYYESYLSLLYQYRLWAREPCVESLYYTTLMPVQTDICVERDHRTGQLCGYKEVIKLERVNV